jgi:sialic acid synthase SpsE
MEDSENMTYIIAEIGVNHNGDIDLAKELVHAAKLSGANAVKVQIFKSANVVNEKTELAEYQKVEGLKNQLDLIRSLEIDEDGFLALQRECEKLSIDFLASTFDSDSMEFAVDRLKLKYLKIASGEITNSQHLYMAGASDINIILSTGTASIGEVERALSFIYCGMRGINPTLFPEITDVLTLENSWEYLRERLQLMHCSSSYPASLSDLNLKAIKTLHKTFGLDVGYSDHSPGSVGSIVAVSMGATIIEKHLTLDKSSQGPDHAASLDAKEFTELVNDIRAAEAALGKGRKLPTIEELNTRKVIRRTLFAKKPLRNGDVITTESVHAIRSQVGIKSEFFFEVIGKTLTKDVEANTPLAWSDFE